jgi:hypothetical protein
LRPTLGPLAFVELRQIGQRPDDRPVPALVVNPVAGQVELFELGRERRLQAFLAPRKTLRRRSGSQLQAGGLGKQ